MATNEPKKNDGKFKFPDLGIKASWFLRDADASIINETAIESFNKKMVQEATVQNEQNVKAQVNKIDAKDNLKQQIVEKEKNISMMK